MYYLLRAHAGFTEDGKLLGVPIITNFLSVNSDFNLPRNTFQECVDKIKIKYPSIKYKLSAIGNIMDIKFYLEE